MRYEHQTDRNLKRARLAGRISASVAAESQVLAQDNHRYIPNRVPELDTLIRLLLQTYSREWHNSDPDVVQDDWFPGQPQEDSYW